MSELIDWLKAQLDEDERTADGAGDVTADRHWRATEDPLGHHVEPLDFMAQRFGRIVLRAGDDMGCTDDDSRAIARHIARYDPASAVADIEAKRALIEEVSRPYLGNGQTTGYLASLALRLLASAYRHRPGYQEAWRP